MRHGVATALVAAGLVTGCATERDEATVDGADPPPPTTSAPEATAPPEPRITGRQARIALRGAIDELLDAGSARYEVDFPLLEGAGVFQAGAYQLSPPASEAEIALSSDGPPRVLVRTRTVGSTTWIRVGPVDPADTEVQNWPCWVDVADVADTPGFPPEYAALVGSEGVAAVAAAASYGIATELDGTDAASGTSDLAATLGSVSTRLLLQSGIDPQGVATVPTSFDIDQGVLAGFSVDYRDIPGAVAAAGGDQALFAELFGPLDGEISARFTDVGDELDIQAPPTEEILSLAPGEDFETGLAACGRG